jgi:hypothetical protein
MTEHARSEQIHESGGDAITVQLSREEVEALLLAVDALKPLLDRLRAQIAPVPVEAPAPASPPAAPAEDALHRVTRLARKSLHEAKLLVGERKITAEQRTAWQEAARRYWLTARHSVRQDRPRDASGEPGASASRTPPTR